MSIDQIFYLTATIVLLIFGLTNVFLAYQIYKVQKSVKKIFTAANIAKYSVQSILFKSILGLLGEGGENNE